MQTAFERSCFMSTTETLAEIESSSVPALAARRLGTSAFIQSMEAMTSSQVSVFPLQVSVGFRTEQYLV